MAGPGGGGGSALASETASMGIEASDDLPAPSTSPMPSAVSVFQRVKAEDGWKDFAGDILDGFADALAQIAVFVAVTEFQSFMLASAGAGRHGRAATAPLASRMSTSTVGLPRESRISRALMSEIVLM